MVNVWVIVRVLPPKLHVKVWFAQLKSYGGNAWTVKVIVSPGEQVPWAWEQPLVAPAKVMNTSFAFIG